MKMLEYGSADGKKALLIHPMLANSNIINKTLASRFSGSWHFYIPDLSGHGSAGEFAFTEVAKEADDIHAWFEAENINHFDLIWGASLGAAAALALTRYVTAPTFDKLILDGTPYMSAGRLVTNMIAKKMVKKHFKASRDRELSVKKMTELYGECGEEMADELIRMEPETLKAVILSCSSHIYPVLSEEQQKNTVFLYGEGDYNLKDAEKQVPIDYPDAELRVLPGHGHCAMMGKDPEGYVKLLEEYMNK